MKYLISFSSEISDIDPNAFRALHDFYQEMIDICFSKITSCFKLLRSLLAAEYFPQIGKII